MDEKRILELACVHLGVDVAEVIAHRVYEDRIAMVVNPGPKYTVLLSELQESDAPAGEVISTGAKQAFNESEPKPDDESKSKPKKVDATPGAKRLAREHKIDLSTVKGSGRDGRIVKADVEAML